MADNIYIKFQEEPLTEREKTKNRRRENILQAIFFFIPNGNPTTGRLMDHVYEWWLEIDPSDNLPKREIGIDKNGQTLFTNPTGRDLGLWTDEEVTLDHFREHFNAQDLRKELFENRWSDFDNRRSSNQD
ncbi:MAG: hypothetical protein EOP48_26210 [Sphingobacteriales bacterium]|nr:MAG: hypothetical protein EOP48_26210 [Sphingobacteriales bacterium]